MKRWVILVLGTLVLGIVIPSNSLAQDEAPCWHALVVGVGDYNGDGDYTDPQERPGIDNNNDGDFDDPEDEAPIDNNNDGDYIDPGDLDGPQNDMIKVRQILPRWGFHENNIITIGDRDATRDRITRELGNLVDRANDEECCVFFFFSGHGTKRDDDNDDEDDDKDEGIVLFDGVLWDDDLADIVSPLNKEKGRMIIEISSCFSAGMIDFEVKENMFIGWACEETEAAIILRFRNFYTVWTYYVFEMAFQDENKDGILNGDENKDGRVCVEEANRYGRNCQRALPTLYRFQGLALEINASQLALRAMSTRREDIITSRQMMLASHRIESLGKQLKELAENIENQQYEDTESISKGIYQESKAIVEKYWEALPPEVRDLLERLAEIFKDKTRQDFIPQTPGLEDGNTDEEICCGLDPVCSRCFSQSS